MQPLQLPNPALSLSSHPELPRLAIGTTANLHIAESAPNGPPRILCTHRIDSVHATACFDQRVLAASLDRVHALDADRVADVYRIPRADGGCAVTALAQYDAHAFLVGDSDGGVHFVDTRVADVASTLQQGDYITALKRVSYLGTDAVLSTSGDGTLCAYDIRYPKPKVRLMYATDSFKDDLLSLEILNGRAIAGTLSGALNVYDLAFMNVEHEQDVKTDRFFGHPECVTAILKWEDVVVTASSDGYIRVVDVFGRKLLGVLEYDMEGVEKGKRNKDTWPVEEMVRVSGWDKPVFALQGHDELLRFCDGAALVDDEEDGDGKSLNVTVDEEMGKKKKKRRKGIDSNCHFFDDL